MTAVVESVVHSGPADPAAIPPGPAGAAPAQSKAARLRSRDPDAFPLPTGREEEWRFTPVRRFAALFAGDASTAAVSVTAEVAAPGRFETVDRDSDTRVGDVLTPRDRVSALTWAACRQAHVLSVPAGAVLTEPVRISVTGTGGTAAAHLLFDLGAQSEATVVVHHHGSGPLGLNTEARIGDGAVLRVVHLYDLDRTDGVLVEAQATRLGRDAQLRAVALTLGGTAVRVTPEVSFAGPGGDAELLGLGFTTAGQHHEAQLFVDHNAPHCRSRVTYKEALQGDGAHAVWIGDVLIRAQAVGTDTYELNRNLVLTDGARADSVPNLEIETGEVTGAGHASATGRFDDEQLFYLMSRGVPPQLARRLVVHGFFADVISAVPVPDIRDHLQALVDDQLGIGFDDAAGADTAHADTAHDDTAHDDTAAVDGAGDSASGGAGTGAGGTAVLAGAAGEGSR